MPTEEEAGWQDLFSFSQAHRDDLFITMNCNVKVFVTGKGNIKRINLIQNGQQHKVSMGNGIKEMRLLNTKCSATNIHPPSRFLFKK